MFVGNLIGRNRDFCLTSIRKCNLKSLLDYNRLTKNWRGNVRDVHTRSWWPTADDKTRVGNFCGVKL